jgi:pimeloyl-ACP methyl ester carboxylesterase
VPVPSRMPDAAVTIFYLHGFASSPQSTKAAYFAERLQPHGVAFRCPDFNLPDFRTLTMTRMLEQVRAELAAADPPSVLIGSSLGGTVAILAAAAWPPMVDRLVLLAPAVKFARPGHHLLPAERVEEWRRHGSMSFFHYAAGGERLLDYAFYADTVRYDAFSAPLTQPTLIFQGRRDTSVEPRTVEAFARRHPHVRLTLLDDDHQLVASLARIWAEAAPFLELPS